MRRRSILVAGLAALLVAPEHPSAQQTPAKIPRIGILSPAEQSSAKTFEAFRKGLRDLGYVDGRNIVIEYRLAAGDYARLGTMAAELVRLPVDIIVTDSQRAAQIARETTRTIPIVMATAGVDPVGAGLAASLAHPGGNATGFSGFGAELSGKRLQLLKEAFPPISRVAVLRQPTSPLVLLQTTEKAARDLGLQLSPIVVVIPGEIPAGFEAAVEASAEALVVLPDAMFWNERARIVTLAAKYRIPAIYPEREYVDDGGLLSYGPSVLENFRLAAGYVDKILKGAKPGDLPIQLPTRFELVVNLKTAKALDVTIPPAILNLADEVIE
jgi:putative tryptophan/tyrosine transport system substrate-binding protein